MNTLYFDPTDILFFRDGRPMSGSLAGHGAAWPLPTVMSAALFAALHRASQNRQIAGTHLHSHTLNKAPDGERTRLFGSLQTAGPFPVLADGTWLFPRPLDAGIAGSADPSYFPLMGDGAPNSGQSSLPQPLLHAVGNTVPASKEQPASWWSSKAWQAYLTGEGDTGEVDFRRSMDFSDTEYSYGIGLDDDTDTQDGERFYSVHYLRLRDNCRMGVLAEAWNKTDEKHENNTDLIQRVFPNHGARTQIIAGGQQRVCTVVRPESEALHLPVGLTRIEGREQSANNKYLIKWILLTPAIFPKIESELEKNISGHPGGWLPSWVNPESGRVLLKSGEITRQSESDGRLESREDWRVRVRAMSPIDARLVAAMVDKAIPVTGYALTHEGDLGRVRGPKPTHLAIPAGSVYYFECGSSAAAEDLLRALNWHGLKQQPGTILNRRSTVFGEKGFGIGVCTQWRPHSGERP